MQIFSSEVMVLNDTTVLGLVDGIDVQQMYYYHQTIAYQLYWQISYLNDTLREMCQPINSLQYAVMSKHSHHCHLYFISNQIIAKLFC